MKTLAFITFIITSAEGGSPVYVTTDHPTECIITGDRVAYNLEAGGFLVDYFCEYTHAPAASMRPRARPVRTET